MPWLNPIFFWVRSSLLSLACSIHLTPGSAEHLSMMIRKARSEEWIRKQAILKAQRSHYDEEQKSTQRLALSSSLPSSADPTARVLGAMTAHCGYNTPATIGAPDLAMLYKAHQDSIRPLQNRLMENVSGPVLSMDGTFQIASRTRASVTWPVVSDMD
eukprot:g58574.t1